VLINILNVQFKPEKYLIFFISPIYSSTMNATKLIAEAREFRDASISRVEAPLSPLPSPLPKNVTRIANDVLSSEELKITSYDAVELIQAIREKVFTCEAVTRAFLRRAALAQKLVISLPLNSVYLIKE
jgi:hypothetical protein